ncbi:hypothetical protein [Halohasta litorea]|uniref:Uncharacterized protein n=1 Tax=Halohasta litorea TaxID=869891 RepID=A0ABD6D7D1_9EURY|nr:hypothetical protein [Halohasta litorea]
MGPSASFDALSRIIEQYESNGRSIQHIEATAGDNEMLEVTIELLASFCAASGDGLSQQITPADATVTENGTIQVEFSNSDLMGLPSEATAVTVNDEAVQITDDGLLSVLELRIDPSKESGQSAVGADDTNETGPTETDTQSESTETHIKLLEHGQSAGTPDTTASDVDAVPSGHSEDNTEVEPDPSAVRDDSLPPYEDTAYLQQLYEVCDNFTEMSRRIEMDVSSETVRRYMIDANIHTPNSYNTADSDNETAESVETTVDPSTTQSPTPSDDPMDRIQDETLVTDGLGLPESVEIEDIADAVVDSMTVYEVQRQLQLDRTQTRTILQKLDLLDLVSRTVSGDPERSVSYDQIAGRIQQCNPSGA